jgi:2-haloacid dehalogenase
VEIDVLLFDVFGTVVDWRTPIVDELESIAAARGMRLDARGFADAWRRGYAPAMDKVRRGELPWMTIDALHRMILDRLLFDHGFADMPEHEVDRLNRVWHRLRPWPDVVEGLSRLKRRFVIATLSNGNMALLAQLSKHAALPWDALLSAELFRLYKPDPEVYLGAARLLGADPERTLLVAAHPDDLHGARACGLKTAFVSRPMEFGPTSRGHVVGPNDFDFVAKDFLALATTLGA